LGIVQMKTGSLFAAASELGAMIGGASATTTSALKAYGLKIGAAYQIYDDCVDIAGSEDEIGKTLGTDLRKGKLTLPVLMLLRSAPAVERERLCSLILDDRSEEIALRVKSAPCNGALSASVDLGQTLVRQAQQELDCLPANRYAEGLMHLGEAVHELLDQFRG
jgi:octaprenyl-diphosphate synthase